MSWSPTILPCPPEIQALLALLLNRHRPEKTLKNCSTTCSVQQLGNTSLKINIAPCYLLIHSEMQFSDLSHRQAQI